MRKYIILYSLFVLMSCESNDNPPNNIVLIENKDSFKSNVSPVIKQNEYSQVIEATRSSKIKKNDSATTNSQTENSSIQFKAPQLGDKDPKIKTYPVSQDGWGYDILVNGKVFISQPNIPAINGNVPFKSSFDAEQVAALMIFKMKANINPPSVSIKELDSLNIKR